ASGGGDMKKVLRELLTSKSIVLLMGGMAIGLLAGKEGTAQVAPLFEAPFRGVLTLFLLEIGLVTGRRLGDLKQAGWRLIVFGIAMPIVHGILGVALGHWSGMGVGGSTVLGTLAASASYIAAPAAVRVALPSASPAIYLTSSLAVTFPFNVVVGIPLYFSFARWIAS
ncbi:MAG: sodium-dependent bicarbonate transport family permease, partial [Verrucomicrobiota bacterium]